MAAEPGLTLTIYTSEPGTASEERLRLLGSWAATHDTEPTARRHDDQQTTSTLHSGQAET